MFHSRKLNNRINKIHERALRLAYQDNESEFTDLLRKDESFTIHERTIPNLAIELYKITNGISPKIMDLIIPLKSNNPYPGQSPFQTRNVRKVRSGTDTLAHLGPKVWKLIPESIKKAKSLNQFKKGIKQWRPSNCPCRLCKIYIKGLGFISVGLTF